MSKNGFAARETVTQKANEFVGAVEDGIYGVWINGPSYKEKKEAREKLNYEQGVARAKELLAKLEEDRERENRRQGTRKKRSREEYVAERMVKSLERANPDLMKTELQYNFDNHAHALYHKLVDRSNATCQEECARVERERQFDLNRKVPREQSAEAFIARSFELMQLYQEMHRGMGSLCRHFHNMYATNKNVSKEFLCVENCRQVDTHRDLENHTHDANCLSLCRQTTRHCVAHSLFERFYVPILFARRSARLRESCVWDKWSSTTPLCGTKRTKEEQRHRLMQVSNLFDVEFLRIEELMQLLLAPLRHYTSMFVYELPEDIHPRDLTPEEAEKLQESKKSKKIINKSSRQADVVDAYQNRPEKSTKAFRDVPITQWNENANAFFEKEFEKTKIDEEFKQKMVHVWRETTRLDRKSDEFKKIDKKLKKEEDKHRSKMQETTRNGVCDEFSEERTEVYRTVVCNSGKKATSIYARYHTKAYKKAAERQENAADAYKHFIGADDAYCEAFEEFCKRYEPACAEECGLEKRHKFLYDRRRTLRLYVAFCNSRTDLECSQSLLQEAAMAHLDHIESQISNATMSTTSRAREDKFSSQTPNFRAWACATQIRLIDWFKVLLKKVLRPAEYFEREQLGCERTESESNPEYCEQYSSLQDLCEASQVYTPWLFEKNQHAQSPEIFSKHLVEQIHSKDSWKLNWHMFCQEYDLSIRGMWTMKSAAIYFNKFVMGETENCFAGSHPAPYNINNGFPAAADTNISEEARVLLETDQQLESILIEKVAEQPDNGQIEHLLKKERELQEERNWIASLWTICAEPFLQGKAPFTCEQDTAINQNEMPFAASKRRLLGNNPYVAFDYMVWQVLQNKWDENLHTKFPHVAPFVHEIVLDYAKRRGYTNARPTTTAFKQSEPEYLYKPQKHVQHKSAQEYAKTLQTYSAILHEMRSTLDVFQRVAGPSDPFVEATEEIQQFIDLNRLKTNASLHIRDTSLKSFDSALHSVQRILGSSSGLNAKQLVEPFYPLQRPFTTLKGYASTITKHKPINNSKTTAENTEKKQNHIKKKKSKSLSSQMREAVAIGEKNGIAVSKRRLRK